MATAFSHNRKFWRTGNPVVKRSIVQGLGAFTPSTWAEIRGSVESKDAQTIEQALKRTSPVFYAKLTLATKVAGRARWQYEWVQVVRKASTSAFADTMFDTLVGGRNSNAVGAEAKRYAVNLLEVANTDLFAYGIGVTTDGVAIASSPTYQIKRIPEDTIVEMRLTRDRGGLINPTFSAVNPIDGACAFDISLIDGGQF